MSVSQRKRFLVFERDAFTCQYCGRHAPDVILEVDHIIPRSKGGTDALGNLTTACFECNRGKRTHRVDDNLSLRNLRAEQDERFHAKAGEEIFKVELVDAYLEEYWNPWLT